MPRTALLIATLLALSGAALTPATAKTTQPTTKTDTKAKAPDPLPGNVSTDQLPANAPELSAVRDSLKAGQTVTFRARVPLAKDAFAPARATFTVVDDASAADCCPKDGSLADTCTIPRAKRAAIQIVDKSGQPLPTPLNGKGGLQPGAEVFITGTVAQADASAPAVIAAASIHVPQNSLPIGFFPAQAPEGAKDVTEAKAGTLKKGDTVTLRGLIGGSAEPFVAGRAVFTLMGNGLKPCNAIPGDECETPWDYCCDVQSEITAHSATIRVADARGNPLRTDIKGRMGIKELSDVIVVGKVAVSQKGVLIVDAERLYPVTR